MFGTHSELGTALLASLMFFFCFVFFLIYKLAVFLKTSFWEELGYVKVILNTQTLADLEFYWTLKLLRIILYTDTEATALQSLSLVKNWFVMQSFLVQQSSRMLT